MPILHRGYRETATNTLLQIHVMSEDRYALYYFEYNGWISISEGSKFPSTAHIPERFIMHKG